MTYRLGFDMLTEPTIAQLDAMKDAGASLVSGYVSGYNGEFFWPPELILEVFARDMYFNGIVAPDWQLSPSPTVLVTQALDTYRKAGCFGAICLDTEIQEEGTPGLQNYCNAFARAVVASRQHPVDYSGAQYDFGYIWQPRWSDNPGILGAAPEEVPTTGAIQYAGNIEFDGTLVDYSALGDSFPMCFKVA